MDNQVHTGRGWAKEESAPMATPLTGCTVVRSDTTLIMTKPTAEFLQAISAPPVCLSAVSRTLELSLQSSFQLSLTVLLRYRTRASI